MEISPKTGLTRVTNIFSRPQKIWINLKTDFTRYDLSYTIVNLAYVIYCARVRMAVFNYLTLNYKQESCRVQTITYARMTIVYDMLYRKIQL